MIIKVKPDKEKVRSMKRLVESRIEVLPKLKKTGFPNIVAENYYEIIKEISSMLLLSRGFKSMGQNFHKDLFDFLYMKKIIAPEDFVLINDLRIRRNKSFYQGKEISQDYINIKEKGLNEIIKKLRFLLNLELKEK